MNKPITIRNKPKPFAWSYSKLKNFEVCPFRHYHVDIARTYQEEESEALTWGNAVHKALAERLAKGTDLPTGMQQFEPLVEKILGDGRGQILVEQKYAINKEFGKTGWFDSDTWYRGIGDVVKITGRAGLIGDHKTGKIVEDSQQLMLMAACLFAHHPELEVVRSVFFWLKEDAETRQDYTRASMPKHWADLWPRIEQLEQAHSTNTYPKTPNRLCRSWCPVSDCEHHGV